MEKTITKVITDGTTESMKGLFDGDRFALNWWRYKRTPNDAPRQDVIILNIREAKEYAQFIIENLPSEDRKELLDILIKNKGG